MLDRTKMSTNKTITQKIEKRKTVADQLFVVRRTIESIQDESQEYLTLNQRNRLLTIREKIANLANDLIS